MLVGEVAGAAGLHAPVAFGVAAALAALSAFSFAELSARLPKSAGEAVYIFEAFGSPSLSAVVGLLVVLAGTVSSATIVRGFAGYFDVLWDLPDALTISAAVVTLGLVAAWGIAQSVRIASAVTLLEVGGLLLVGAAASGSLATLPDRAHELVPSATLGAWSGVASGAFLAFYAFIGFEDMVNVAEEVRRPERNLPLAIVVALATATLLYLGVALVSVLAVPPEHLAGSGAPLALVWERSTGSSPTLVTVISLLAVTNGALIQIIMGSRVLYGLASQGWLPRGLARVHPATRTPLLATGGVAVGVLVLALGFPLGTLARATSFVTLGIFALVNAALLRIRRRDGPAGGGVPHTPLWVPRAGLLASAGFMVWELLRLLLDTGLPR